MSDIGMAWYTPEAWRRLAAMPQAKIQKSYDDFVRAFEAGVREFAAQGIEVEKVTVDIDQMIAWCHRNGYEIDAKGRAFYGTVLLMARDDPRVLDNPVVDNTRNVQ